MSSTFRNKLADDIANHVASRNSGGYFNYGTIKIKRHRWAASLIARVERGFQRGNVEPLNPGGSVEESVFYRNFQDIGTKLIKRIQIRQRKATWQLTAGTQTTNSEICLNYKRKNTTTRKGTNIESGIVEIVKEELKKLVLDQALEYVHGRTGTGQFDNTLFRSDREEITRALSAGESMEGGQGVNVDQAIARAIDENMDALAGEHLLFQTIVQKYNDVFGYEHDVKTSHTRNYFKRTMVMRGFIDPQEVADNANDYDVAILEDIKAFLRDTDTETAVEIMRRLKRANPNDWKGIGPKKMGALWSDSPNILDSLDKITKHNILQGLFGHKIRPDLRLKVNKKLIQAGAAELGKKASSLRSTKTRKGAKSTTSRGKRGPRRSNAQTPQTSPLNLRNLLNDVINEAVGKNMISPRLRYRTGRFANSVEVTNVMQGRKGGLIIDYTYQRDPYSTFEVGGRQGSQDRDPRDLIGTSIREVAQQIVGKKFIRTRRV